MVQRAKSVSWSIWTLPPQIQRFWEVFIFFFGGAGFTNSRTWKMNLDSIRVHRGPWASWYAKVKTNDSSLSNGGPSIVGMESLRPLNFDGVIGRKLSIWFVLTPIDNVASANEGHIMFPSTWGSYQWIMSPFNTVVSTLGGKLLSTQWLGRRGIHFVDMPCWESTVDQPYLWTTMMLSSS